MLLVRRDISVHAEDLGEAVQQILAGPLRQLRVVVVLAVVVDLQYKDGRHQGHRY